MPKNKLRFGLDIGDGQHCRMLEHLIDGFSKDVGVDA